MPVWIANSPFPIFSLCCKPLTIHLTCSSLKELKNILRKHWIFFLESKAWHFKLIIPGTVQCWHEAKLRKIVIKIQIEHWGCAGGNRMGKKLQKGEPVILNCQSKGIKTSAHSLLGSTQDSCGKPVCVPVLENPTEFLCLFPWWFVPYIMVS